MGTGQHSVAAESVQAVITQVPVVMGINFIGEFAPEITGLFMRKH
jgi:hypothetical protein